MRAWWLCAMWVACLNKEESCSTDDFSVVGMECEEVETCCTKTECAYITMDGTRYECDGLDCGEAAEATICDVCPDLSAAGGCE